MVDVYWRIAMEGDAFALRLGDITRGGFGPFLPGSLGPGLRTGAPDGYGPLDYMAEVARSTEQAGFVGGLMPSFPQTDDPWAAASALAHETSTYRFMIAFQPGFLHPVQAARMSATLQAATGGRVVYNIISGGGGPQQLWWGDRVDHDDRYTRTSEFLDVLKGVWHGPYDHEGRFYRVEGGALPPGLRGQPFPEIYFSGSSPAAIAAAGRHADYYLSWLEPFDALAEKFDLVRRHSDTPPKFAVRVDVLARETEEQAWEEIERGWERLGETERTPEAVESVGWRRGREFTAGTGDSHRDLEVQPNVWGGFNRLRPGPLFGLVGDYHQVAARLDELIDLGVDAFILAGVPHLEEAQRVGRHVLPLLKGKSS
ncbi:LLM class flavin-dependent oxidoreductase [Actinoallomurus acaciae]|uniref:LLM class flavin-dependent oxidoreductase n=1 Tax=Actinoallomurus acaciae TaxID=502577 RepID=A0ABV5YR52_9ACTN